MISPLGRYRIFKQRAASGEPMPEQMRNLIPSHEQYFGNEDHMADGSAAVAIERGNKVHVPPVPYIQGTLDEFHPRPELDRFVATYGKAGGKVDLRLVEGERELFIYTDPSKESSKRSLADIVEVIYHQATIADSAPRRRPIVIRIAASRHPRDVFLFHHSRRAAQWTWLRRGRPCNYPQHRAPERAWDYSPARADKV